MESMILEIQMPGSNEVRDFTLPSQIPVRNLLREWPAVLEACTGNVLLDSENPVLCLPGNKLLDPKLTLAENGIREGQRLILV